MCTSAERHRRSCPGGKSVSEISLSEFLGGCAPRSQFRRRCFRRTFWTVKFAVAVLLGMSRRASLRSRDYVSKNVREVGVGGAMREDLGF
jgi:hypothetical protein